MPGCDGRHAAQRPEGAFGFPRRLLRCRCVAYLDHAATTPLRPEAPGRHGAVPRRAVFGNPSGVHSVARRAKTALEEAREEIAAGLGCRPGEVVVTGGGTEADNLAVIGRGPGRGRPGRATAGRHRARSSTRRCSAAAHRLEPEGFEVRVVRRWAPTASSTSTISTTRSTSRSVVVSVMLVNNEVGTIQPLAEVAELVRARAPGRGAPHRCRAGGAVARRRRGRRGGRPGLGLGPQVRRPQGRRARSSCARGSRSSPARGRRPGARPAVGDGRRRRRGGARRRARASRTSAARGRRRPGRSAARPPRRRPRRVPGVVPTGDRVARSSPGTTTSASTASRPRRCSSRSTVRASARPRDRRARRARSSRRTCSRRWASRARRPGGRALQPRLRRPPTPTSTARSR